MRDQRDPRDIAREKLQQVDQKTLQNLQSRAGQYGAGPMTPESFVRFAGSLDDATLRSLSAQLGVNVDPQVVRSLTPDKIRQLMRLLQEKSGR